MQYESYLMHYGVKGMRWGISNSKYYKAVGKKADPSLYGNEKKADGSLYGRKVDGNQDITGKSIKSGPASANQDTSDIVREKISNSRERVANKNSQPTRYYNHLTNSYVTRKKDGRTSTDSYDRYGNAIYKDRTYNPSTYEEKATITDKAKNYYGDGKKKSVLGNLLTYSVGQAKINTNQIKKASQSIGEILNRNISEVKNNDKKVIDAVGSVLKEGFSVASQAARDIIASPFNVITNTLHAVNADAKDKRIESAASFFGSITDTIDKRGKSAGNNYRPSTFYDK